MEAGGAVGCRGVAKFRTAHKNSNPAAMLVVADGPRTPPLLIRTEEMQVKSSENNVGDKIGGLDLKKDCLTNFKTLHPSSLFLSAFNAHANFNVG